MANSKFYLDTRGTSRELYPLKLAITHKHKTALLNLDIAIRPEQWNATACCIVNHPQQRVVNNFILKRKLDADKLILQLIEDGEINNLSAQDIKDKLSGKADAIIAEKANAKLFANRFLAFAKVKKERTRELYMQTYRHMSRYTPLLDKLRFEDITKEWLIGFDTFLAETAPSQNARNIHLRNIRAVFNEAIDDEITTFYPFRRFKIRNTETVKRSLSLEQLRTLFSYPVEPHCEKYLDFFKLSFFLCGINIIDLLQLKDINGGRIEYHRSKTNKLYSIKVEPEAQAIIDKYRGKDWLLDPLDRYNNYKDFAHRLNDNLQTIGKVKRIGRGGKKIYEPLFPKLTTYWARHTWATIAAELDIPKETISAGLGHEIGSKITSIYINFDQRKVDAANRRIIDYVLYDKR